MIFLNFFSESLFSVHVIPQISSYKSKMKKKIYKLSSIEKYENKPVLRIQLILMRIPDPGSALEKKNPGHEHFQIFLTKQKF